MLAVVCIASHLGSLRRRDAFLQCLESLSLQTRAPDLVLVSYSFAGSAPDETQWTSVLGARAIAHRFYKQDEKKTQFEHYEVLSNDDALRDTDVVMFSDDDDLYHERKVETVMSFFRSNPNATVFRHGALSFGNPFEKTSSLAKPTKANTIAFDGKEYWLYSTKASFFRSFVNNRELMTSFPPDLIDCSFALVLENQLYKEAEHFTDEQLCYHRLDPCISRDYTLRP